MREEELRTIARIKDLAIAFVETILLLGSVLL
jgi:hypothetical protein